MSVPFLFTQYLILALGVAAGAALLVRRARAGKLGAADVLGAGIRIALVTGGLTLLGLVVGVVHVFGVVRLGFLAGTACVPLVGAGLLAAWAARRVRVGPGAVLLALLGLAAAPLGAWMAWVEPYDLRVETAHVDLPAERAGTAPLRVGVLADLQCDAVGEHERRAVATLLAQDPDVIVVPGDVFQGTPAEWERWRGPLIELLATVRAPGGVWFVPGDTDRQEHIRALREGTDWKILIDDVVETRVHDRVLRIAGLANRRSIDVARELESLPGDSDVRLVVSHAPDVVLSLRGTPRADLVVAGHTHGGQIVVPGFGPPMTLSHVPREMAAGGLHRHAGRAVYVSRGVGVERRQAPRVRLLCPPEVSVLTLGSGPVETP